MSKLLDADKSVKAASRELDKIRSETTSLERDRLQMLARNKVLITKTAKAEKGLKHNEKLLVENRRALAELRAATAEVEAKNDALETQRAEKALQIADIHAELASRKTSIDRELEAYSLSRKQEIRDQILAVNEELLAPRAELATFQTQVEAVQKEIDAKREELRMLNQAAIQEQTDVKLAKETIDGDLVAKQAELTEVKEQVEASKKDLQKLFFDRDNAMMTIQKAKDEHQKYVDYEQKSRKILDAKDRELQERETDISEKSQFLQNRRSFLPPL